MTENRSQPLNVEIETFVRESTSLIAIQATGNPSHRRYKCRDCDKEYDSFQALGGHRASHRNIRAATAADGSGVKSSGSDSELRHKCPQCGKKFAIGQELGGHMRKHYKPKTQDHKENIERDVNKSNVTQPVADSSSSSSISIASNSKGKVVFDYDLNLTPRQNELRMKRRIKIFENPKSSSV